MMRDLIKIMTVVMIFLGSSSSIMAAEEDSINICRTAENVITGELSLNSDAKDNRWDLLIKSIATIESNNNSKARNPKGDCCGLLQITPILVKEVNRICKFKKLNKHYTLSDRFNAAKSKEIFGIFQDLYNPSHNIEKAIRMWNGGPNYSIKKTQKYYNKVIKVFNKLENN